MKNLTEINKQAKKEIEIAKTIQDLKDISKKYLGKKSRIAQILSLLTDLPLRERIEKGKEINRFKREILALIQVKENSFEKIKTEKQAIDVTAPGKSLKIGHFHPLTIVRKEAEDIFQKIGFEIAQGPEVEDEKHNFDFLNIPKDHPARDMWDTFWLKESGSSKFKVQGSRLRDKNQRFLLRTHTSPVQIRYMEKHNPPLRIIAPGRCFRYEATDASHEINFYHIEGLMIDNKINAAHFKAIMKKFFETFFQREVKLRIRPSFFPFTEPSFEIDIECLVCQGKGCSTCSQRGWIEMAGAGMVHPNVFKAVKLNPKNWQGFAFGLGLDRLTMMKYKIDDIRLFYSSDLRFLEQF
jgi:phenylalanyl-tRNA synthetase alpha chain